MKFIILKTFRNKHLGGGGGGGGGGEAQGVENMRIQ